MNQALCIRLPFVKIKFLWIKNKLEDTMDKMTNNDLQITTQKTKDRATRTPLKNRN